MSDIDGVISGTGLGFSWPEPWSGIGLDWTAGCREKYTPASPPDAVARARADLVAALDANPATYFQRVVIEQAIRQQYRLDAVVVRTLISSCPGSASLSGAIWCAQGAVDGFGAAQQAVLDAIPAEQKITAPALTAAVAPGVDETSLITILNLLCAQGAVVVLGDAENGPCFTRWREDQDYSASIG